VIPKKELVLVLLASGEDIVIKLAVALLQMVLAIKPPVFVLVLLAAVVQTVKVLANVQP